MVAGLKKQRTRQRPWLSPIPLVSSYEKLHVLLQGPPSLPFPSPSRLDGWWFLLGRPAAMTFFLREWRGGAGVFVRFFFGPRWVNS